MQEFYTVTVYEDIHVAVAGVRAILDHEVEALVDAVVGIGHHRRVVVVGVAHQKLNLVMVAGGRALLQFGEVFPVHGEDQVEFFEIFRTASGKARNRNSLLPNLHVKV